VWVQGRMNRRECTLAPPGDFEHLLGSCYIMAVVRSRCGHYIFILSFVISFLFSSPNLSRRRCMPYFRTWCGLSANLRCRSETCYTRLAANTGRKKSSKNRHLGTIVHLCRAISSQLRHVSTIRKKLVKHQYLPHMAHNMMNFDPLAAEIDPIVWGTPANFSGFGVLTALLHGTQVLGVSHTLRR